MLTPNSSVGWVLLDISRRQRSDLRFRHQCQTESQQRSLRGVAWLMDSHFF